MSSVPTTKSQKLNIPISPVRLDHSSLKASQGIPPQYALRTQSSSEYTSSSSSPHNSVRLTKRKMDLNSQLQAAASYHAAMNANGSMNMSMNGSMLPMDQDMDNPPIKKTRTNTPWTPEEEKRLKELRDVGTSWSEIAKSFPNRTEGSVKKHWYKDMHYAEFTEEEKNSLFDAIREYDANKWKSIGNKVGKPAKACEQFAREHFNGR